MSDVTPTPIPIKHGFPPHHTNDCDLEFRGQWRQGKPHRKWWCNSHGQWCYEYPVTRVVVWEDGTLTKLQGELPAALRESIWASVFSVLVGPPLASPEIYSETISDAVLKLMEDQ